MALGSVGTVGSAQDKTAGTSISMTPTNQLDAGNIGIVVVAKDNAGAVDGDNNEIQSITDSTGGNTWTKALELTNSQGAGNAGATIAIFWSKIAVSIPTTGSITANFSDSRTASAITCWEFSIGAGNTLQIDGTSGLVEDAVNDPGSMNIGVGDGLSNIERIWIRGDAIEGPETANFTPTLLFTVLDTNQTSGGGGGSNIKVAAEFRIITAVSQVSDPVLVLSSRDCANVMIAFSEIAAPTGFATQPQWIQDDL